MKVSLIATILNEEKTIGEFLDSIYKQTRLPDEIVIVDGGSTDKTFSVISNFPATRDLAPRNKFQISNFKFIVKGGNRAVGRNEAVKHATGDIIVCTDGDCILDKNWVKNIINPFRDKEVDVVAGYYEGIAETIFQKCLIPYVLVMPDKVDPGTFLPASRTMAFRKSTWKSVGGFLQEYSHNEDYVFAKTLEKLGTKIVIAKNAIAYWRPRKNLRDAVTMFFRFAYGDAQAGIMRTSVMALFIRYFLGVLFLLFALFFRSIFLIEILILSFIIYIIWTIQKNYCYVKNIKAVYILPILQLSADVAVISGTIGGGIKRWVIRERR